MKGRRAGPEKGKAGTEEKMAGLRVEPAGGGLKWRVNDTRRWITDRKRRFSQPHSRKAPCSTCRRKKRVKAVGEKGAQFCQ